MNTAKQITPEEKSNMAQWIEEHIVKSGEIENMMSNTSYLEWLIHFTQDKDFFSDDNWLYFPEKIEDSDRENVEKLDLFYAGIDQYARQNYIYPTPCEFGHFYKIRFHESGFGIGISVGQETVCFCNKIPVEKKEEFIDFKDIIIGKKQDQVDQINTSLDSLSNMVITTYESGVPIEAIVNTLDNLIKEIISKKEDKTKTFIKK